jgi:hypothetical protein
MLTYIDYNNLQHDLHSLAMCLNAKIRPLDADRPSWTFANNRRRLSGHITETTMHTISDMGVYLIILF